MTTLARLSFWIPEDRDAEFAETFEKRALPLLQEHGLTQPLLDERPAVPGVFSRLFAVESPPWVIDRERQLQYDPAWQECLLQLGQGEGTPLPYYFGLYATPVGPGRVVDVGAGVRRGTWHSLGVQDGLLSSAVTGLQWDWQGYLWLATGDGVSRYDGAQFVHYTVEEGVAASSIAAVVEDAQGHLWFGASGFLTNTHQGLTRYDGETFQVYTTADGLTHNGILSLVVDRHGVLWVSTPGGLSRWTGDTFTSFTEAEGLPPPWTGILYMDSQDRLWMGTWAGVCCYEDERFTRFGPEVTGLHARVWNFLEDRDGRLWMGAKDGVRVYDGRRFMPVSVTEALGTPGAAPLLEDRTGRLWFSAFPEGVFYRKGEAVTGFTRREGLPANQVEGGILDGEGSVWIITNGGGISRYEGDSFTHFTTQEGLLDDGLFFVTEDGQGQLWVGTFQGVCRYDGTEWIAALPASHWREALITLIEDSQGRLWGVTHRGDVQCCEAGVWRTERAGPPGVNTGSLAEDRQGRLWCANGSEGVLCYDGGVWQVFTPADGLVDPHVRRVLVDRQGQVWLVTMQGGISQYDGQRFKTVSTGAEVGYVCILTLFEDRQGRMWFGTEGRGVVCYEAGRWRRYTTTDGLACNRVLCLGEDRAGHLWLGTQGGGVSRYDGRVFQTLSQRGGLLHDVVKGIHADRQGGMWLATEGGLTRYQPGSRPPAIQLQEMVADQTYAPGTAINVPQSPQGVRFAFQGRSFTTLPPGLVYVYRLQGHEADWQVTRQRQVRYRDLPRGAYTFQVQAVDRDLNYSEPATVVLQVEPDPRIEGLQAALKQSSGGGEFVGQSAALQQVLQQLGQVAQADVTVLILGETGTGKGLVPRGVSNSP